jgi:hypothetical protein
MGEPVNLYNLRYPWSDVQRIVFKVVWFVLGAAIAELATEVSPYFWLLLVPLVAGIYWFYMVYTVVKWERNVATRASHGSLLP